MFAFFLWFRANESGAVTVDWIAVVALVVGLTWTLTTVIGESAQSGSQNVDTQLGYLVDDIDLEIDR